MGSRTAITVLGSPDEVRRMWQDPTFRPEYIADLDAAITFRAAPGDRGTEIYVALQRSEPQGKLGEAMSYARAKSYQFVRFEPWAAYDARAEFFERFALALLTFPRSIETDLSMRTRVYDYLWCGLPIVSSPA